ncbi:hypothetical protein F5Y03DRAFT_351533 [Xylaria venustula]|nr:hypothetical protein F5Y03DRAFT_351533 [Xylaria venustula]
MEHMSIIIYHVHRFISEIVKSICPDPRVHEELWNGYLLDELMKSYRRAMEHARFLLRIEREGLPLTLMHTFRANIRRLGNDRLADAIIKLEWEENLWRTLPKEQRYDVDVTFNMSKFRNLTINKDNAAQVREQMHDLLSIYYEIARQRFVDVVYQQAINHYLLSGDQSPLKIFNTEMVLGLNEEQLDLIAAEDSPVKQRREKLVRDIENFTEALKVLKGTR